MVGLAALAAVLAVPFALACGDAREVRRQGPVDFTGYFEVQGSTETERSEIRRPIRGNVIIARHAPDAPHVVTFSLKTVFATPDGPMQAELIGSAEAQRSGDALSGHAETQILMGTVPGVDPTFPYIPARLGARIASDFRMVPDPDADSADRFRIEIESRGARGDAGYEATRTTLRAERAADFRGEPGEDLAEEAG
jgi:hypothetical protein